MEEIKPELIKRDQAVFLSADEMLFLKELINGQETTQQALRNRIGERNLALIEKLGGLNG